MARTAILLAAVVVASGAGVAAGRAASRHGQPQRVLPARAPVASHVGVTRRPGLVRVVVRLGGAPLALAAAEASDPDPANGAAALRIAQPGIGSSARPARRHGVAVRIRDRGDRLRVALTVRPGRFKYLARRQHAHGVVVDLHESGPPSAAAEVRRGAGGCLRLLGHADTGGAIIARGTARNLFERTFALRVRDARGRVVGQRIVTTARRTWRRTVSYRVATPQPGTLEAVADSARDGALDCLVQVRAPLAP